MTEEILKLSLAERLVKVRQEVGAIYKEDKNSAIGYSYRGYEAIYSALRPLLDKYGIIIASTEISQLSQQVVGLGKHKNDNFVVSFKYTVFIGAVGREELLQFDTVSGNHNTGIAQAYGGALSYAMSRLWTTILMIPTDDIEDPDATNGRESERASKVAQNSSIYEELRGKISKIDAFSSPQDIENLRKEILKSVQRIVEETRDNNAVQRLKSELEKKKLEIVKPPK